MAAARSNSPSKSIGWTWPLVMTFIRLPLILLVNAGVILALQAAGFPVGFGTGALWYPLSVSLVNVACLALLLWRGRVENLQWGTIIGFERRRLLRDLGWGLLWSLILFVLMMGGVTAAVLTVRAVAGLTLQEIYAGTADFSVELPAWLTIGMVVVSGVLFPILNAPVEELQYRAYAQLRLTAISRNKWIGIFIPALGFGLQHVAFAYSPYAAPAFAAGFFLWGLGAGVILRWQQRLAPLIVAHLISNLSFGIVPLLFVLSGA